MEILRKGNSFKAKWIWPLTNMLMRDLYNVRNFVAGLITELIPICVFTPM